MSLIYITASKSNILCYVKNNEYFLFKKLIKFPVKKDLTIFMLLNPFCYLKQPFFIKKNQVIIVHPPLTL